MKKAFLPVGSFLALIFLLFAPTFTPAVHAQSASTPVFLVTWKTSGSYVPSNYPDKPLPTYGSQITASVQLFVGGQLQNLADQTIYWYGNSALLGGGVGAQQISFPPLGTPPSFFTLEVEIPSFNGNFLIHDVQIPMVNPVAVVYAPYPGGQTSANPINVQALPYFFNVSDPSTLSYAWQVNDQTGGNTENPQTLQISVPAGTPSGTSVAISLTVQNAQDSTVATANANLTYVTQL
jgi:hypothetical protein